MYYWEKVGNEFLRDRSFREMLELAEKYLPKDEFLHLQELLNK